MHITAKCLHTAAFLTVVATGWTLAVPPSHAGLRDTLKNVRDTVKCTSKAVLNPLRVVDWGMKNFEKLTSKEYERRADATMKEALAECREAAKNIVARGFGVEKIKKIVDKASDVASRAKSAANTVSRWFGKGKKALDDGRRALAVSKRERPFYEKETGVLGRKPLPAVKDPAPRADDSVTRSIDERQHAAAGSASAWDREPAGDPRVIAESGEQGSAWDAGTSQETDPYTGTEVAAEIPPAPLVDENDEADVKDNSYTAMLDAALGDAPRRGAWESDYTVALAVLEQREVDRQRKERETELARMEAERQAELAQVEAKREAELAKSDSGAVRSQDCGDPPPPCRQALARIGTLPAKLEAFAAEGLSMSQAADLMADIYKGARDNLSVCYDTERRPRCREKYRLALEEIRRAYKSSLGAAREYRGGLRR